MNVYVGLNHVSIGLKFKKWVLDIATSEGRDGPGFGTTWDLGSNGAHGQDAGFIHQGVSEHVDEFIGEHLWVNEQAC